ncbi:MAG: hypothetical protein HYX63_04865 [Gammaproteobacteria bacterium]|nr:hypothetical protein [Gammaproteobacteria bacterium]
MGDVIQFRKPRTEESRRGKTLCREGFHQWAVWHNKQFDVKRGKLVTVYRCSRCGETKVQTH